MLDALEYAYAEVPEGDMAVALIVALNRMFDDGNTARAGLLPNLLTKNHSGRWLSTPHHGVLPG